VDRPKDGLANYAVADVRRNCRGIGHAMKYFVIQNRETNGPFTIGQLRSMWNSGAITGSTLYCREGSDEWSTLEDLAVELEQTQQPSPPVPTAPPPLEVPRAGEPPRLPAASPNLRRCGDCSREVSILAESCPNCGATFATRKKHGVFFYVFWGVISLIGTAVILVVGIAVLSAFFAGVHKAVTEQPGTVTSGAPSWPALTAQEKENAEVILSKLRRTTDQVTGTTWLEPSWADGYDNQVYLYIGLNEAKEPFLRLKIEYKGEELLIIRNFVFRIDDTVETIKPKSLLKNDYVVENHWEWFDELAEPHFGVVRKISKGKNVLMRCVGRRYNHDRTVSAAEKDSLDQIMLVYRYLDGQRKGKR